MKVNQLLKTLILIILVSTLQQCKERGGSGDDIFLIDLELKAYPLTQITLKEVKPDGFNPVDTTSTDEHGKTTLTISGNKAAIYLLEVMEQRIVVLSVPGEEVRFESSGKDLKVVKTSGSIQNVHFQEYNAAYDSLRQIIDSLSVCLDRSKHRDNYIETRDSVGQVYSDVFSRQQAITTAYLKQNPTSLGALIALNQRSGPRPLFNVTDNWNLMIEVDSNLMKAHPGNEHIEFLHQSLLSHMEKAQQEAAINERLKSGNEAPEIVMQGQNGEGFRLSELRGKVVLLHFWASWSPDYRKDMETLRYLGQVYAPWGFDMVSISFDNKRYQWLEAVKFDFMQWTQLCDLLYPSSPLQKLYAIGKELPVYYLIDRDGTLAGRYRNAREVQDALKTMKWEARK
jgi:peroxiredoxin